MKTTFDRFLNQIPGILLVLLLTGLWMLPLGPQETRAQQPGDIIVNSTADNLVADDGQCTLREAITNANADADTSGGDCAPGVGTDTVLLPAGVYTLAIVGTDEDANATGDLDISDPDGLTIIGDGPQTTIIQAGTTSPVSGTCTDCVDRVLHTPGTTGGALELSGLTIRHGMPPAPTGGGGDFWYTGLSLIDVVVTDNLVRGDGDGGGLRLWHGWLDATRCAFVNNRATNPGTPTAAGGLDIHHSVATLTNVTVSGNVAHKEAGGLRVIGTSSALIQYSTIVDNHTEIGGKGGGLHVSQGASVTLVATILAGNTEASADISMDDCGWWGEHYLYTDGNNLLGDGTGCPAGASDLTTTDISAELDVALALNGGLTPNHANQNGGQQINVIAAGTNGCGTDITEDQRGYVRPQDAGCDIGACEGPAVVVDSDGDGVPDGADNCSRYNPEQTDSNDDGQGDACDPLTGSITATPSSSGGPAGVTMYFNTTWRDPEGWEDLKRCYFHIGASPSPAGNVTLMYDVQDNKLWMRSDDGTAWLGGCAPWSDNTIENRQAKVYCVLTRAEGSGDTLSVRWAIKFKADFRGVKKTGLKCTDLYNARAKGAWMGTWNVY